MAKEYACKDWDWGGGGGGGGTTPTIRSARPNNAELAGAS